MFPIKVPPAGIMFQDLNFLQNNMTAIDNEAIFEYNKICKNIKGKRRSWRGQKRTFNGAQLFEHFQAFAYTGICIHLPACGQAVRFFSCGGSFGNFITDRHA